MAECITRDAALRVIAGQRGPIRSPAQNSMLDLLGAAILSLPAADEEAVEGRALRIAADLLAAAGLCRYEERGMCAKWRKNKKRKNEGHCGCENCLLRWVKRKAWEELKGE